MNIRDRQPGTPLEEGVQVTETGIARYFYFRRGEHVVLVRLSDNDDFIEVKKWQGYPGDLRTNGV